MIFFHKMLDGFTQQCSHHQPQKAVLRDLFFYFYFFFFTLYQQLPVPQGRQHKSKTTGNGSSCQVAFFEPTLSRRVGHIEQASGVAYHVPSLSKQRNEGSK